MSAIDRAFIKAYSDESDETPRQTARTPRRASSAAAAARSAASKDAKPTTPAEPVRRANRAKRSAAAAALDAAKSNASAGASVKQSDDTTHAEAATAAAATSLTPQDSPKMVVGRRALQRLAESASATSPHAAFAQKRPATHVQILEEQDPTSQVIATVQDSLAQAEQAIGGGEATARRQTAANSPQPQQYRLDNARHAAVLSQQSAEPFNRQGVAQPSTPQGAQGAVRPLSSWRAAADFPEPLAALEVDRFRWPAACELLIKCAAADLESVADALMVQSQSGIRVVAVVSADERDGCTTIVQCLARMLVARAARVCLIDADFHQPRLAESLGLAPQRGLESLLAGETTTSEVLVESMEDRLTLLPLAATLSADEIERSTERQTAACEELCGHFDVILVDAGCVGMPTRRPSILHTGAIEAAILVRTGVGDATASGRARRWLDQCKVQCMGIIENRCA